MADQENEMEMNPPVESSMDESQGDTWQEEHPPEDDFHDQAMSEDVMMEEEEGGDVNPFDPAAQPEEKKSKKPLIVLGVLALLLAGIGGVIYTQLGSSDIDLAAFQEMPQIPAPPPAVMTLPNEIPATPKTAESDLAALAEASRQAAADQGIAQPAASPAQAEPAPLRPPEQAPTLASTPVVAPLVPSLETKPEVPPAASPALVDMTPMEKRLTALEGRMDELQKSLENIGVQSAEMMSRLEKGMGKLAQQKTTKRDSSSVLDLQEALGEEKPVLSTGVSEEEVVQKPKATIKKKSVAPKAVKKKDAPKTKWVLRAATPDGAWLSQGANGTELRKVEVGETIPGLGKIKSIREKNGSWEVIGTNGSVR